MSSAALKIDQTSQPNSANKFSGLRGNNISAESIKDLPAFSITQMELSDKSRAAMVEFAGNDPGAVKRLARALGCSVGTAKNYLEGRTTPQGIHDSRAMAVIPSYFKMKMELAGRRMELDPGFQAQMVAFMRNCAVEADRIFGSDA